MDLQARMNTAFDNYLALSDLLMADGQLLLDMQQADDRWQRIFIRTAVALVEGYSNCFREMAAIGFECDPSAPLSNKEREVLTSERGMSAGDRIKLTLRATHLIFALTPLPDFSGEDWSNAMFAIEKRHVLLHPKTVADLEISFDSWARIHSGLSWLVEQHFNVVRAIHRQYFQERGQAT